MPFSLTMSKNIKSTTTHVKYSYISIFTNLLQILYIYYGLRMKRKVLKLYKTRSIRKDK